MKAEFKKFITVQDFIDKGFKFDRPVFLHTFNGYAEVSGIRWPESNPWAVCPKENGGFGMSFCVHYGTKLYHE